MAVISMKQPWKPGFILAIKHAVGTRKWLPYIFTERNGIYIIDLQKTVKKIDEAYNFIKDTVAEGKSILFVGTKKQAQDAIKRRSRSLRNVLCESEMVGRSYDQQ